MAKARKQKNEEQKTDSTEAVVRHQKLCLSIDIDNRRIYGYTELEIVVPDNGIVGLHADNLAIESVTVDGEPAEFEVFPHYLHLVSDNRWCSVSSTISAADAAGSVYLSSLERELVPNLLIMCCKFVKPSGELQKSENSGNEAQAQSPNELKQNVKIVHIDYWVEKAETGIHFGDKILHTDNQIRRARCWLPCMDDGLQQCCYDMEFTVANNLVAVSTGTLLYQVLTKDDPPRKTYVYRLNVPIAAQWISLVVAPFEIIPDRHILSYMCLPNNLTKLRNTMVFFHTAYSHYEEYLSASFPFGSYTQVFISPEMAISSLSLGASLCIFSSQVLFDEKVIDRTIESRIKLACALARQWFGVYITAEAPNDEWLLDGLAGFLTDSFIKRSLGNNEARYRRYKANCAVCKADDSGATALSASPSSKDLYGTECIGLYSKIRSWKSVAIIQMLEKQMGPESFRKILQMIISRAQDTTRSQRTLSTKEFRHFANKVGNLERPFLKEFFPRWVGSCGCPVLKMGFSYNKRKNMIELAVLRGCTATPDTSVRAHNGHNDLENREGDVGWPGMMSIRVHELDGMYDHPILPMTGDSWQLLEIQCHSKLAAKRFQKPKKGSDDNGDGVPILDMRSNSDSPVLWLRADPEMEYLAEVHLNQPVQMWINQLEKDKDVVAQAQAIATLEALPQLSYSVVNALSNFLSDSKAFWRVRIEAAFALANTTSEEADLDGLGHLLKFYKSQRFDASIGLPKPNDFHDIQEYFVLEAIPHAIAMIRAADQKSPKKAVEFILQLLKYNDNNGNPYSDVFWLAALVQSIGELEFGQESIIFLSSLLKRIDRLLQFDRLMPSYNGILTVSCIQTLTQIGLKLSEFVPLNRVIELVKPFRGSRTMWQVRIEASKALLDLEFHSKGIDAVLMLFIKYLDEESSLRGQVKLGVHTMRLCQMRSGCDFSNDVKGETLVALLRLLESRLAFNNACLRHYVFCILQVLARRPPTLYGVPRDETLRMGHAETCSELKNIFAALVKQSKPLEIPLDMVNFPHDGLVIPEAFREIDLVSNANQLNQAEVEPFSDGLVISEASKEATAVPNHQTEIQPGAEFHPDGLVIPELHKPPVIIHADNTSIVSQETLQVKGLPCDGAADPETCREANIPASMQEQSMPPLNPPLPEPPKEADTVSNGQERKRSVVKIRVKHSAASSRAEDVDHATIEKSQGLHNDADRGASSSVSVDAPQRHFIETLSISNQNIEDVNSCHDVGSRVTASIGSAKHDGDEFVKELQCTADSSRVTMLPLPPDDLSSPSIIKENDGETETQKYASLQLLSVPRHDFDGLRSKEKDRKKEKDKKRKRKDHKSKRDDPEYLERKRLKKEKKKKKKEKEMAKLLSGEVKASSSFDLHREKSDCRIAMAGDSVKPPFAGLHGSKAAPEARVAMGAEAVRESPVGLPTDKEESRTRVATVQVKPGEPSGSKVVIKMVDDVTNPRSHGGSSHKLRIKLKNRTLNS